MVFFLTFILQGSHNNTVFSVAAVFTWDCFEEDKFAAVNDDRSTRKAK